MSDQIPSVMDARTRKALEAAEAAVRAATERNEGERAVAHLVSRHLDAYLVAWKMGMRGDECLKRGDEMAERALCSVYVLLPKLARIASSTNKRSE